MVACVEQQSGVMEALALADLRAFSQSIPAMVPEQYTGTWRFNKSGKQYQVDFCADGSFTARELPVTANSPPISKGEWTVINDRELVWFPNQGPVWPPDRNKILEHGESSFSVREMNGEKVDFEFLNEGRCSYRFIEGPFYPHLVSFYAQAAMSGAKRAANYYAKQQKLPQQTADCFNQTSAKYLVPSVTQMLAVNFKPDELQEAELLLASETGQKMAREVLQTLWQDRPKPTSLNDKNEKQLAMRFAQSSLMQKFAENPEKWSTQLLVFAKPDMEALHNTCNQAVEK